MTAHLIEIAEPAVSGSDVRFSWTVRPATPLYRQTSFYLRFPDTIDLKAVPGALWWRIALMCLHTHWPLLRPCRILLPVRLPPGEVEFWLRLTDAAVATLEAYAGGGETARSIEIVGSGPLLGALEPSPAHGEGGIVSLYSGGRDGMTQAAILSELGEQPTLVAVTSPVPWCNDHDTRRRREVLSEAPVRRSLELVEVFSDMRRTWENGFAGERYRFGVHELTDLVLYLAVAVAVAAARGASLVLMASEAEVQENCKRDGMIIQTRDFPYSAATHSALAALLRPMGIAIGSLTNSLHQFQVQRLLSHRYRDLLDLQCSCWAASREEPACSRCNSCRRIGLNLLGIGLTPALAGIDPVKLLLALADWEPGSRYPVEEANPEALPWELQGRAFQMQELRCLAGTSVEEVAKLIDSASATRERDRALAVYARLRERALNHRIEPEPGYRAGYLELLDQRLRDRARRIFDEHFVPAPSASYSRMLANTRLLAHWITAPLDRVPPRDVDHHQRSLVPRPPRAASLSDEERQQIRELIPDPEPAVSAPAGGRLLRVAETLLDGNETAYLIQCVEENRISSAGEFVPRLERAFAEAVGCRFAVACSSGTAALHLALAAAGVASGDEVIVPAFTMVATANAVRHVGADPVLVDAARESWNLDPGLLPDKLTSRTRALIAVHTYGQPAEMGAIVDFTERNRLVVIEDAAEAHGSRYGGRPAGSLGAVAAFSFYGNKILTTGEGGILTSNDRRIADVARELRDHGFSRDRHFWHRRVGHNYRMSSLQAAVGVAQTERFQELIAHRIENARRYRAALSGIEGLGLPPERDGGVSWMFGVTVDEHFGISRDELRRRLARQGIETRTFFVPLHLQPVYHRRFSGQRYPVAEELGRKGLYLPSGPGLSDDDIAYVADALRAVRAPLVSGKASSL